MSAPLVILTDLDDCQFQTLRKCTGEPSGLQVAAVDRSGEPLSYSTPKQRALLDWMRRGARLLPVTGRNVQAFRRVRLPFTDGAICSFGGVVLTPGGAEDPEWHEHIQREQARWAPELQSLVEFARTEGRAAGVDLRASAVGDLGMSLYLSVKHNRNEAAHELVPFARLLRERLMEGWRLHMNDNNLAALPPYLAKERAVAWYLERRVPAGAVTVGFGDSQSDAPFLALCDYTMLPSASQLGRRLHALDAYSYE